MIQLVHVCESWIIARIGYHRDMNMTMYWHKQILHVRLTFLTNDTSKACTKIGI